MGVTTGVFGTNSKGEQIGSFTLTNSNGTVLKLSEMGAAILELWVKDRDGNLADVVLGFDNVETYEKYNGDNHGSVVGRSANRIKAGHFVIDGKEYQLALNDGPNNLHSGPDGYNSRKWNGEIAKDERGQAVVFTLISPDGDQGMPGKLELHVKYVLTEEDTVILEYTGVADKKTVVNPTNHSYFNLAGHNSGTVYDQYAWIDADAYTYAGPGLIPTGELVDVTGTPMDFRTAKTIGEDIGADYEQLKRANGYDHNYVLHTKLGEVSLIASLYDKASGRLMEVFTELPGMQIYTGNFLGGELRGKCDCYYKRGDGVCFETQFFPDSVNNSAFLSPVVEAGVPFCYVTSYRFSVK